MIKIHGTSDDLLYVISTKSGKEHEITVDYENVIECTDGTKATLTFEDKKKGVWLLEVQEKGKCFKEAVGYAGWHSKHYGLAEGCTPYSDVLILEDMETIVVNGQTYEL